MKSSLLLAIANFFSAIHFFLVIYVCAPYLATLMPSDSVGLVLAGGAVVTIIGFLMMPRMIRRFGPRKLSLATALLTMLVLLGLSFSPTYVPLALALVALATAASPLLLYYLDLLLEQASPSEAGAATTRAFFFTAANIALIATPLILGYILGADNQYSNVFIIAFLSLIPFILIMGYEKLPEAKQKNVHTMRESIACLMNDRDLRAVMAASMLLQIFFNLAPLYIPLYLHTVLGFPWSELGWMFAVMLIPFIILEYPAGWIADHAWGDRELMALGFTITGIAFAAIGFITNATNLLTILIILVFSRIGAALVEAMTEGHFFRRVTAKDTSSVAVFRLTRPLGMLIAPLMATALLLWADYGVFFVLSGAFILVAGVASAFCIKDIR